MTGLARPPAPESIVVDRWTAPFWEALRGRRIVVCTCGRCGTSRMPPGPFCPACQSADVIWKGVSGRGQIYSFTVVRAAHSSRDDTGVAYAPAVVELDGAAGVRLVTAIVDAPLASLQIGAPVSPVWHTLTGGQTVPYYTTDAHA